VPCSQRDGRVGEPYCEKSYDIACKPDQSPPKTTWALETSAAFVGEGAALMRAASIK